MYSIVFYKSTYFLNSQQKIHENFHPGSKFLINLSIMHVRMYGVAFQDFTVNYLKNNLALWIIRKTLTICPLILNSEFKHSLNKQLTSRRKKNISV